MFENDVPKHKVGVLHPLAMIDNSPYEFYRLAPPRIMMVMIAVGLAEFSSKDVERVFAPLDGYLDQLMERGIDLVMQNGVPLPLLIGLEAHDRMIDHMGNIPAGPRHPRCWRSCTQRATSAFASSRSPINGRRR